MANRPKLHSKRTPSVLHGSGALAVKRRGPLPTRHYEHYDLLIPDNTTHEPLDYIFVAAGAGDPFRIGWRPRFVLPRWFHPPKDRVGQAP